MHREGGNVPEVIVQRSASSAW